MQAAPDHDHSEFVAPERIIAATRGEFRAAVLAHLEQLSPDVCAITIDLRKTVELDASGLGILVFVQKRAKERGLATQLRHAPERVRNLLKVTMLDFLFELIH